MAKDNRAGILEPTATRHSHVVWAAKIPKYSETRDNHATFLDALSALTSQPADMHQNRSGRPRSQNRLLRLIGYIGRCRTTDTGDESAGLRGLAGG